MYHVKIFSVLALFLFGISLFFEHADAKPYGLLSRQKRVSDQRLAELETMIALRRLKERISTMPVGHGKTEVDPMRLGRRRREVKQLLRILYEDLSSEEEDPKTQEEYIPERNDIDENNEQQEDYDIFRNLLYNKLLRTNFNEVPR